MIKKSIFSLLILAGFNKEISGNSPSNIKLSRVANKNDYHLYMMFKKRLMKSYPVVEKNKLLRLRHDILQASGRAVPVLVDAMKGENYPDNSRWMATFLLGQIMGGKASKFIATFITHPNWILRMASLKTLLALKESRYARQYAKALKDDSLLVRRQALENIVQFKLKEMAPLVWDMMDDKRNYYDEKNQKGATGLVKMIIRAVGELKFNKALGPLVSMLQNDKYRDSYSDIEYSLRKITDKSTPLGVKLNARRQYWSNILAQAKDS